MAIAWSALLGGAVSIGSSFQTEHPFDHER
jgi:hypothetical protein